VIIDRQNSTSLNFQGACLKIFDLTGRLILTKEIENNKTNIKVDTGKMLPGTYILKITFDTGDSFRTIFLKG